MNTNQSAGRARSILLYCLLAIFHTGHVMAVIPATQPVITSLALAGTNLIFSADFPANVERAVLELRPTLADNWQQAALLDISTNGGNVEFSIPQPASDTAFFRLNVTLRTVSSPQVSGEVHYQAGPPLTEVISNGVPLEAVFHFKGMVDGSDRIVISHEGAFWDHVNWGWPGTVLVNKSQWNPLEKNFLTTTGAVAFLPEKYSLAAAHLEVIEGRDVIALEQTNGAVIVYLDDTPSGAAPYEFKVHFRPATAKVSRLHDPTSATLKIAAQIDGSDRLKITAHDATWFHSMWAPPNIVRLNEVLWDLGQTNVLPNSGTNMFLPSGIDISTARIVHRSGRDLATMWADKEALWVTFADNPNGSDSYEVEISFGQNESLP